MGKNIEKVKTSFREGWRKLLVGLKRNPQYIPLASLLAAFLVYSLNLTAISNTTAKLLGQGMGLCAFVSMLFSILSFVCMLNAFPKRKKPNIFMILVMFVLFACILFADLTYVSTISSKLSEENAIQITADTMYIMDAWNVIITHMCLTLLTGVLVILEPLFAKLLKLINTSIEVEDNGKIENIELTDDE